jgi:sugar transferase (PEP-CTERM/EpsH1 system associated)
MSAADDRLLVAHIVYRFDVGGLENGVVNLINRLPAHRFRHAVVALTEVTDFRRRVERDDVHYVSMHKPPGQGVLQFPALYRLLRTLRPDVVHTRNLAALEAAVPAWFAGVPARVHGEHGWDVADLDGGNRKHRWIRRAYRPFVTRYVALSKHIEAYLSGAIGVAPGRISQIYNGVDCVRFRRVSDQRVALAGSPFGDPSFWLVGTVGRLADVKNQSALVRALGIAFRASAEARARMRVAIVGAGPQRAALADLARVEGVAPAVWLAGERSDVAEVLRDFDVFALPSLAEGISNTLLEAMSSSLPVVATRVGGNVELIEHQVTGTLIEPADPAGLADALLTYFSDPTLGRRHGQAARRSVEAHFSLDRMAVDYAALYEAMAAIARRRGARAAGGNLMGEASHVRHYGNR